MNIAWVTVRSWDDMCTTTTDALVRGLIKREHQVTILNADAPGSHDAFPWEHVALHQSKWPGKKATTLAKSARVWFEDCIDEHVDVFLVDWPLAPVLGRYLAKKNRRLVLIDRSPPADATFLAKLQWRSWARAWSMLKKGEFSDGLVVSKAHQAYVVEQTGVDISNVHCIPAGVSLEEFQTAPIRKYGPWKFVYHGRLDKHRGVLALPMLMQTLANKGFEVHLTLIGEGDVLGLLQEMAEDNPLVSVVSQVPRPDIPAYLEKQHIGLLPMPRSQIWSLASPLKRSEYLAAGLLVYGIDHSGHRIDGKSDTWFKLSPQEEFHNKAGEWVEELSTLSDKALQELSGMARTYAERYCSWEMSVDALERVLQSGKMEE